MAGVKYKGKTYRTKRELAEQLGINYDTLNMRMSRGLTLKQAVEFKPKSTIRYKKVEYRSYQDLIDTLALNLTVNQLQYRLKKCNGSLVKAVKYQVPSTEIMYKGKSYESLKQLCDALGLVYSTVKNRINRQGKTLGEAIAMSRGKQAAVRNTAPKRGGPRKKTAVRLSSKTRAKRRKA